MKVHTEQYSNLDELRAREIDKTFPRGKVLLQVFSGLLDEAEIVTLQSLLRERFPSIPFIGATTSGEIVAGRVFNGSIVLSFMFFEATQVTVGYFYAEDARAMGAEAARSLFLRDTKLMILFIDGLTTNGSDVIDGISGVDSTIPIAGGMAADNGFFIRTFVFTHEVISSKGMVAAGLHSTVLRVATDYQLNWQPIGKVMTVTKAEGNRLYEVDHTPLDRLYRQYLGDNIGNKLPHSATEFPLIILAKSDVEVCRTFTHLYDDGSLQTIGNLHVGEQVKFAYGNVKMILSNSDRVLPAMSSFKPEAIYLYSCTARITFLQSDVVVELAPIEQLAPTAGFFTYGEILHKNDKNHLLNITLTTLSLSESSNTPLYCFRQQDCRCR